MNPTQRINGVLARTGLEVRRKPPILVRSPHDLTMTLDFVAAHYQSHQPGPKVVVQIGAFDGQSNDPVVDAISRFGWQGVLVEPQPEPYARLAALHRDHPGVQTFNVAISDHDGKQALYFLDEADDLPEWASQLASFNRAHLERQTARYMPEAEGAAERIQTATVETWTFDTLLRQARVSEVDVLQVDTEGFDLEVLRMFDLPLRRPAIVCYEHQHLDRADRAAAADLLVGLGYRMAMNYAGGDTIAYLTG